MIRHPPRSPLFPSPPLSRSRPAEAPDLWRDVRAGQAEVAPGLGPELQLRGRPPLRPQLARRHLAGRDRKSTRLNSSHLVISYAVFCLKKKNRTAIFWESIRS